MNFLDAHKILYDYIKTLKESAPIGGIIRKKSTLKNTQAEILAAYKIFLAHMYLFHTRTQEEYESLQMSINELPSFIEDNEANIYIECKRIVDDTSFFGRRKNKSALPLAKDTMQKIFVKTNQALIDFCSSEDSKALDAFTEQIANEAEIANERIRALDIDTNDGWKEYMNTIASYCSKAYSIAGIPEDYHSIDFFYSFSRLRALAEHPAAAEFFAPYKSYIFANR